MKISQRILLASMLLSLFFGGVAVSGCSSPPAQAPTESSGKETHSHKSGAGHDHDKGSHSGDDGHDHAAEKSPAPAGEKTP